jgi:hypothetical protein
VPKPWNLEKNKNIQNDWAFTAGFFIYDFSSEEGWSSRKEKMRILGGLGKEFESLSPVQRMNSGA